MRHRIKRWLWPTYYAVKRMERMMSKSFDVVIHTQEKIMALADEIKAKLNGINNATNEVAATVARLVQGIKNSMTDEELAALKADFTLVTQRLTDIAATPDNPVPVVSAKFDVLRSGKK